MLLQETGGKKGFRQARGINARARTGAGARVSEEFSLFQKNPPRAAGGKIRRKKHEKESEGREKARKAPCAR